MADLAHFNESDAQTFMIAAGLVFEIIAAFCSSPQTTELNAKARSSTLMKWVGLGMVVSAIFVGIAAVYLHGGKPAIWGGGLAGAIIGVGYLHANQAGLSSAGAPTERY